MMMERKRTIKTISFSTSSPQIILIPRLDDSLINDYFYQDEEIADFRHEWFLEQCGLSMDMTAAGVLVNRVHMEQKQDIASPTTIAIRKQRAKDVRTKWTKAAAASAGPPTTASSTTTTASSTKVTMEIPDTVQEIVSVVTTTTSTKPRMADEGVVRRTKTMLVTKAPTAPPKSMPPPPRNDGTLPSHEGELSRTIKPTHSTSSSAVQPKRTRPFVNDDDNKNKVTTNSKTTTSTVLQVVVVTATSTPTTETTATHNLHRDSASNSSSSESSIQNKDKLLLQQEPTSPRTLLQQQQQQQQRRAPSPPSLISSSSPRSVTEVYVRKWLPARADDDEDTQAPTSHPLQSRLTKQRSSRANNMNDGEPQHQEQEQEPERVPVDAKQHGEPNKYPIVVLSPRAGPLSVSPLANSYGNITKARLRIKGDWRPILPLD
jgi:hypothetical protein